MAAPNTTIESMRRSTRLRVEVPVRLRSLDQNAPFDILTKTLIVNAQGCGLQTNIELPADCPVELAVQDRVTAGRVLKSTLVDAQRNVWVVGVQLERAGNFWDIQPPPADWFASQEASAPAGTKKAHPFAKAKTPLAVATTAQPQDKINVAAVPQPALPAPSAEELRGRFESVLEEFRATLRTQVAQDWEQWRADAITTLTQVQKELGNGLSADAASWREETQKAMATLADLVKGSEERAERAEEQAKKITNIAATAQMEIASAIQRLQGATVSGPMRAEEITQEIDRLKAELQSFEGKAPGLVEVLVKERVEQAMSSLAGRVEQELGARIATGLQQLQNDVRQMSSATEADVRSRMLADFAARQQDFLAAAAAQLGEIEAKKSSLQSGDDDLSAQLSRHAEEAMASLRVRVEELISRHESDVTSRLTQRQEEITQRVNEQSDRLNALEAAAEKALQAIDQRHQATIQSAADLARAADEAVEKIDQRRAGTESAVEKTTAESLAKLAAGFEAGRQQMEESLRQQAWDYQAQAEAASGKLQDKLTTALQKLDADIANKQAGLAASLAAAAEQAANEARNKLQSENHRMVADIAAERERETAAFREQIAQELQAHATTYAAHKSEVAASIAALETQRMQVAAEIAELQKTKGYLETLVAALPENIRSQTQTAAAQAFEDLRTRSEKHVAETVQAEAQRGSARMREEIAASAHQLREEMAAYGQQIAAQLQARLGETMQAAAVAAELRMDAAGDAALAKLSVESAKIVGERTLEVSAATQAAGIAEQLEAVAASAESKSKALQQQVDEAKQWLGDHTAEFQKTVHDAFLLAGGEIRGRVHGAVDSADEMIRQKAKDVMAGVEQASAQHVQALARQAEQAQSQVTEMANQATSSAETLLQSRLAETLDLFRTDAARLAESALSRWQAAMDETLRAIPDLLKNKLAGPDDPAVDAAHGTSAGKR